MGGESSPGDKRILKPTIPGSQGQASSLPMHKSCLAKCEIKYIKDKGINLFNHKLVRGGGIRAGCIYRKFWRETRGHLLSTEPMGTE